MDIVGFGLIGFSTALSFVTGLLCAFFPHITDRFCANNLRPRYLIGMNERSGVPLWRITGLVSLVGFVVLCSYVVWAALLRLYYYGF